MNLTEIEGVLQSLAQNGCSMVAPYGHVNGNVVPKRPKDFTTNWAVVVFLRRI